MFMRDLASRLRHRVQLTTDGLQVYVQAVDSAFEGEIDYAMLRKMFGYPKPPALAEGVHYSPSRFVRTWKQPMRGDPDPEHVSTSLVERQNLTMRMSIRRFTRLTNGFSKKFENHACAVALYFTYYNFARVHQTIKTRLPLPLVWLTTCGKSKKSSPFLTCLQKTAKAPDSEKGPNSAVLTPCVKRLFEKTFEA